MSLSSNIVDSQSLASENGVILILSNFISCSLGEAVAAADGDGDLDLPGMAEQ